MRTLLLALMIVLLPVRGWLGDAMAVQMVRHEMPPVAVAAVTAVAGATMAAKAGAHCRHAIESGHHMESGQAMADGMAAAATIHVGAHDQGGHDDHDQGSGNAHQGCDNCAACQVCHTVALGGMPAAAAVHTAPHASPAFHASRFASAERAPGLKPPIS